MKGWHLYGWRRLGWSAACLGRLIANPLVSCLPSLLQGGMLAPLRQTEMPLVRVLVAMEAAGLAFNEAVIEAGECLWQVES